MTTFFWVHHFVWMGLALWFAWRVRKERRRANRLAWWLRSLHDDGEAFFVISDVLESDPTSTTFDRTLRAVDALLDRDLLEGNPETKKKAGGGAP